MLNDRRIGKFEITEDVINDYPEAMKIIMGTLIVLRVEYDMVLGTLTYTAICSKFSTLEKTQKPFLYEVEYDPDTGDVSFCDAIPF